jgi:TnpA family transposase
LGGRVVAKQLDGQAGVVMPSMLLRKLGTYNRRSRLYRAFRELGRVERTLFLLRYISDGEVRRTIRAETTKIEAYNDFLDWVSFGGPVVKSGDPVEQENSSGMSVSSPMRSCCPTPPT